MSNAENRGMFPLALVTDFGAGLAQTECLQVIDKTLSEHSIRERRVHSVNTVTPFNIVEGAFTIEQLIGNTASHEQTVFVGVVDPGVGTTRRGVVIQTENHTFVGPDNGLFSLALEEEKIKETYEINTEAFPASSQTFHGRDQFAPLGAMLSAGIDPQEISALVPTAGDTLTKLDIKDGTVLHEDPYGNLKLRKRGVPIDSKGEDAATVDLILPRRQGVLRRRHIREIPVVNTFGDVQRGALLVYEGSSGRKDGKNGYIELAVREGKGKESAAD